MGKANIQYKSALYNIYQAKINFYFMSKL